MSDPAGSPSPRVSLLNYVSLIPALVLFVAALLHRLQWEDPARYRSSVLVDIELIALALLMLTMLVLLVASLVALLQGRWQRLRQRLLSLLGCFVVMLAAAWLDPATLLWIT